MYIYILYNYVLVWKQFGLWHMIISHSYGPNMSFQGGAQFQSWVGEQNYPLKWGFWWL